MIEQQKLPQIILTNIINNSNVSRKNHDIRETYCKC